MTPTVLFLTVLGCVAASPNGYYHQEYNYKTSASSYKNNELQHQTDDQGYYRKDGDLEGRVRPRIDANSEHSEYVNPNLRTGQYNTGLVGGANGDLSSYGHLRADIGSYGNHDLSSEGMAHADSIVGSRGATYGGYTSGTYGSNSYGSSSQSYGISSNLRSVTSNIQQDLERDLQRAIQENRAYSQSGISIAELENELRRNLTERLNSELTNRYGQQSIRGGLSYTISGGRVHSTANYDNQELQDLRRQLENTLLNQLRTQYYQSQSSSRYQSQQSSQGHYGYTSTVRPVYYTQYPVYNRPITTVRPVYTADYTRYTPIPNPESITNIASRVQNQLDTRLNQLLEDVQRKYFSSSSSYSLTNSDVVIENLRNELRNNITFLLNEEVKANYGNQIPRDGYMYSVGPAGQTSNQYNYAIKDLENLRSQIERNLIEKLNRDFETYRSRWYQQSAYSQSSHSASNIQYSGYSTPRYDTYSTYTTPRYDTYSTPQYRTYDTDVEHFSTRPSSSHIVPLINSGGSSSSDRHYSLLAGSRQGGYEISGTSGSNIAQLQRQLQTDLSRQLQAAINRGHYGSYSTSGSYNPQSYQVSLQQLSDELNRNLTRQLQEYSASGSYSTYGNFDQAQLASLRSQLQSDLMRQLQQGLQQSYHSSSSYSASSSSSSSNANYRPARGFDNYQFGQYRSGGAVSTMNGADCVGDDPNAYSSHRMKRSHPPYRSQQIGLSYTGKHNNNFGYTPYRPSSNYENIGNGYGRPSYDTNQQLGQQVEQDEELGQLVDESDLTQQVQVPSYEKLQDGQQVDNSDLTQQVEDSGLGKLQVGAQTQQQIDQNQQAEDLEFGELQLGSHRQHQTGLGQQVDESDLTQQVEDLHSNKLQSDLQSQQQQGQQIHDTDDYSTQQVQPSGLGKLQLGSYGQHRTDLGQQVDESDLTQQVEGLAQQQQQGQPVDDTDDYSTQQVQHSGLDKLQLGFHGQYQTGLGHQVDNSQLTQQPEEPGSGKLRLDSQEQQSNVNQQLVGSHLTQEIEDPGYGKLLLGSQSQQQSGLGQRQSQQQIQHGQNIDNSDLTQQIEDSGLGRLELNSQSQQQNQDRIQLGQQEDNSDLTQQQVGGDISTGIELGSSRNPQNQYLQHGNQQNEHLGESSSQGQWQTYYGNSGNRPTYEYSYFGSNLDQNQRQTVYQIKTELSNQLANAVKNYGTYSELDNYQSIYQDVLKELERNLTKQLLGSGRYSYTFRFSGPQAQLVEKQLENELKLQLQQEISNAAGKKLNFQEISNSESNPQSHTVEQETQQNSNSGLVQQNEDVEFGGQSQTNPQVGDLTQQTDNNQISQQSGGISQNWYSRYPGTTTTNNNGRLQFGTQTTVQQPTSNNQQTEDLNPQIPDGYVNSYQPGRRPYTSGSLQFGGRPIYQRPKDNNFLETEIAQQQNLYPYPDTSSQQNNLNQGPSTLPTLNQVIQQQNKQDLSSNIEPLTPETDVNQQSQSKFTNSQEQNINLPSQSQTTNEDQIGGNSGLTQQIEDDGLGRLQLNSQSQQQNQDRIQLGQQEDNSDVTQQQVGGAISTGIELGSSRNPQNQYLQHGSQQNEHLGGFTSQGQWQTYYGNSGNRPTFQYSYIGSNLDQNQKQTVYQIKTELSNQLTDTVKNDITYSNIDDYQSIYQDILKKLERNITKQLLGSDRYSYTSRLSGPQVQLLEKQLENQLKLQLQQEISNVAGKKLNFQEISNSELNHQSHTVGQETQQNSNSDLVQQNEDVEFGGQSETNQQVGDLTQQTDNNQISQQSGGIGQNWYSRYPGTTTTTTNNNGRLQFGTQTTVQQPTSNNQQTEDLNPQIPDGYVNSYQPSRRPYTSGSLQFTGGRPNTLPTLNKPVQQQQNKQDLSSNIEPLTPETDVNQQSQSEFTNSQEQSIDLPSQSQTTDEDQIGGQTQTNRGHLISHSQSHYGHAHHGSGSYVYQGQLPQPTQINSFSQHQGSFQTYLNGRQVQLANQLEHNLSNQLQDAISQNRYTINYSSSGTISPESYQINYEQLLAELQKNITKQLEQTFSGTGQGSYSGYTNYGYGSLTQEQRERLVKELVADLSNQLQGKLQISYKVRLQNNGQGTFDSNANHGSSYSTSQLNYGQQEVVPESESAAPIQPIEPVLPSVVQNVDPSVSQNTGVKGRGSSRPRIYYGPQVSQENVVPYSALAPARDTEVYNPQVELVTPLAPSTGTQEITAVDEAAENLPWWKRLGKTVKQGATSLKEKIIG